MKENRPSWIFPFFLIAAAMAAAASLAALFLGGQSGHGVHSGRIADVTINLNGRPVREHCLACHSQGGSAEQGTPHPDIAPHSWVSLGCTACHLGEGMALDERISHGIPGRDARRILTGEDLQASCFTCHDVSSLPGAEKAWSGYRLFVENACDACHTLSAAEIGGLYGPPLHEIGSYLGLQKLREAIREPKKSPPNSLMPRFALSEGEAKNIALFLKGRVAKPFHATPMAIRAGWVRLPPLEIEVPEEIPEEGALLATRRCLACHRFAEEDGLVAPDLSWIGSMRKEEYLGDFLKNPDGLIPGAIMPRMGMSEDEEIRLVRFLSQQAVGPVTGNHDDSQIAHDAAPPPQAEAKRLYMTLCQRCHAAAGDGFGPIQPDLANFPRPFSKNAEFFRALPDERLQRSLEQGIAGTSMPPYGRLLEEELREDLLDLIFSAFVGIPRDEKIPLAPLPHDLEISTDTDPERLFSDLCLRCHGRSGRGKGPEHLRHLPRPRNLANRPYFSSMDDERIARAIADGIPGTAMPSFRDILSPWELWMMVEKIRRFTGEKDERFARPRTPSISD